MAASVMLMPWPQNITTATMSPRNGTTTKTPTANCSQRAATMSSGMTVAGFGVRRTVGVSIASVVSSSVSADAAKVPEAGGGGVIAGGPFRRTLGYGYATVTYCTVTNHLSAKNLRGWTQA